MLKSKIPRKPDTMPPREAAELAQFITGLGLQEHPGVLRNFRHLLYGAYDEYAKTLFLEYLHGVKKNSFALFPFPNLASLRGDLFLGWVSETQQPVGMPLFPPGITCLLGSPGFGKSQLIKHLCTQAVGIRGVVLWRFLRNNREHALPPLMEHRNKAFLDPTTCKLNLLEPVPGYRPPEWKGHAAQVLSTWGGVWLGTRAEMEALLGRVYATQDRIPSLKDMVDHLEHTPLGRGRQFEYRYAVLNRIRYLASGLEHMDCNRGFDLTTLATMDLDFELEGLNDDLYGYVIDVALKKLLRFKERTPSDRLHVVVIEDAQSVAGIKVQEDKQQTAMASLTEVSVMGRKYGLSLVLAAQHAQYVSDYLLGDARHLFCFSSSGADALKVGRAMNLSTEQTAALPQLPVGVCVYLQRGAGPLLLQVPYVADLPMTEEEKQRHMEPVLKALMQEVVVQEEPEIPQEARNLLENLCAHPLFSNTERVEQFGFDKTELYQHLALLTEQGLLTDKDDQGHPLEVSKGRRKGRAVKLYRLTDQGEALLGKKQTWPGRGGIRHAYACRVIQDFYVAHGYLAEVEHYLEGHAACDVAVFSPDHQNLIGLDVATESADMDNEWSHIQRNLRHFPKVLSVCFARRFMEDLSKNAKKRGLSPNVVFTPLSSFFPEKEGYPDEAKLLP